METKSTIIRIEALKWWNSLSIFFKKKYSKNYFERLPESLTGREIQIIYERKTK